VAESTGKGIIRNTFRKSERLCSRKEIERLFAGGTSINVYPLKLVFIRRDFLPEIPVQTMFVVPKRNFKRAHDRNLLRRRVRESFRLLKQDLYEGLKQKDVQLSMALLFTGKAEESYQTINKTLGELLSKLNQKI
jgi:ribonuclease P protein component